MPNEFYIINHATGRIVDGFPSFAEAERECAWWCEQRQRVYVVRELPAMSFHEMLAYNRRQPASEFKAKKLECDRANRLERLPGPRGLLRHPATYFVRPVALPAAHPVRRMLRLAAMQHAWLINADDESEESPNE